MTKKLQEFLKKQDSLLNHQSYDDYVFDVFKLQYINSWLQILNVLNSLVARDG